MYQMDDYINILYLQIDKPTNMYSADASKT